VQKLKWETETCTQAAQWSHKPTFYITMEDMLKQTRQKLNFACPMNSQSLPRLTHRVLSSSDKMGFRPAVFFLKIFFYYNWIFNVNNKLEGMWICEVGREPIKEWFENPYITNPFRLSGLTERNWSGKLRSQACDIFRRYSTRVLSTVSFAGFLNPSRSILGKYDEIRHDHFRPNLHQFTAT
jgi:hypothetical protein